MFIDQRTIFRKVQLMRLFEEVCCSLDIPPGRRDEAADRYHGVAQWLSEGEHPWEHPLLRDINLYLQGSVALGTAVKPLGRAKSTSKLGLLPAWRLSRDAPRRGEEDDRGPPACLRALRPLAGGDAALLAARVRQPVPSGHHAVESRTRPASTAANSSRTRRLRSGSRRTRWAIGAISRRVPPCR